MPGTAFIVSKKFMTPGERKALQGISRKKPILKNRVGGHVEKAVVVFAMDMPAYGQLRVSNKLKKHGVFVSAGGVCSIWRRHDLETCRKRLKALEAKMAQENLILSDEQLRAVEKSRLDKEACREIETHHPG